nr:hypothetical protein GCM10020092_064480 [Actinoplanes digitatis]
MAVEPLATRLGTTKGSFYWHFGGREELVQAALQLWRQASTTSIIERLESGDAPASERLRQLFTQVFAPPSAYRCRPGAARGRRPPCSWRRPWPT